MRTPQANGFWLQFLLIKLCPVDFLVHGNFFVTFMIDSKFTKKYNSGPFKQVFSLVVVSKWPVTVRIYPKWQRPSTQVLGMQAGQVFIPTVQLPTGPMQRLALGLYNVPREQVKAGDGDFATFLTAKNWILPSSAGNGCTWKVHEGSDCAFLDCPWYVASKLERYECCNKKWVHSPSDWPDWISKKNDERQTKEKSWMFSFQDR